MNVYTFSEARQKLAAVLEEVRRPRNRLDHDRGPLRRHELALAHCSKPPWSV
jgi:hypothetical protein